MAQETAKIKGLLLDLRKDENKPYVTTLGLDAYLAELEKENNAYDRLSRNASKTGPPPKRKAAPTCASGSTCIMTISPCWPSPIA